MRMFFALAFAFATQSPAIQSGVAGVLRNESGRALANTKVLACMTKVCLVGTTGADGRFVFEIEPPVDIVIKTEEDLAASPRRGAAMLPVRLAERRLVEVGPVYAPTLPAGRPLGPGVPELQTLDAGDGLQLTLSRAGLKAQPGQVITNLAARRLPATHVPGYPALDGEEVVAVYALHPFAAKSAAPMAVRVRTNLPDRSRVSFRTINEIDGTFSALVPGRVMGQYLVTDPGAGITELTCLVISRPARSR